jgi:hypothetical protein
MLHRVLLRRGVLAAGSVAATIVVFPNACFAYAVPFIRGMEEMK